MMFWRKKKVQAHEFILRDKAGNERASLGLDAAGNTVLVFRDGEGGIRMFLGLTPDGTPRICLRYAGGKGSIELEANDRIDNAALIMRGPAGKMQVLLGIATNGRPVIALFDENEELVFPKGVSASDRPGEGLAGFDWDRILKDEPGQDPGTEES